MSTSFEYVNASHAHCHVSDRVSGAEDHGPLTNSMRHLCADNPQAEESQEGTSSPSPSPSIRSVDSDMSVDWVWSDAGEEESDEKSTMSDFNTAGTPCNPASVHANLTFMPQMLATGDWMNTSRMCDVCKHRMRNC